MVIELVERLDAAASELLARLKRSEASSEELLGVLSGTRAVRGKLDTVQALAAAGVAGSRSHGDGGVHVLAENTGMSRHDARNRVKTAEAISSMPAVQDAVEDGRVSFANARHLADARDKTSAADVESDKELLSKAESLPPERFAKEAKRWTAERQADGGEAEYRRLRARRAVRVWNGDDGMVHLYGQFDPVTGRRIRSRLNKEAHRLFDADKKHARGGGETRSLKQCMADAFENMTAGTVGGGKPYADIALVARLDPETEKLMVSTGDGDPLPAGVVERLAGESSWFGLVLSAKGVPLWKGRNIRRATESQFQALMALYGGCAGCGEPDERRLHAHHMDPFAWGGGTDLDNLIPLCWGCHNKIHDHGWQVVDIGDGKRTIRPPDRIHHGAARLPDTAPLFGPSEQAADAEPDTAPLFGPSEQAADAEPDTAPLFGPSEQAADAEPDTTSLFARSEQATDAAPRSAAGSGCREGASADAGGDPRPGGGSRAGPTGLQAARAALRRARAAQNDTQGVRS